MLNSSPLSPLMVPNASCSSHAEFRMNSPGGAENQHEACNDFKNRKLWWVSLLLSRASSENVGIKGTKGLRIWSQVVYLETRATLCGRRF